MPDRPKFSASTRHRRACAFNQAYRKAICELQAMLTLGLIDDDDYKEVKETLDKALYMACAKYDLTQMADGLVNFKPEFEVI